MTGEPSLPVPAHVRTLLVFGGAFDPPHYAHVDLPARVLAATGADWLLYVPSARTPLKNAAPGAPDADRLAMLALALEGRERTSTTDIELLRGGASYTIDTLRELRSRLPDVRAMRLLIGADQAVQFHRWRDPRAVIALAEPLVMLRSPAESAEALLAAMSAHWPVPELEQWRRRIVELPVEGAASTDARRLLAESGPDAPTLACLLPPGVLQHIRKRGLYTPPTGTTAGA